jgi:hypothetical protein
MQCISKRPQTLTTCFYQQTSFPLSLPSLLAPNPANFLNKSEAFFRRLFLGGELGIATE